MTLVDIVIVQLGPNAGLTGYQNRIHLSPSLSGCSGEADISPGYALGRHQNHPKPRSKTELGTLRTVHTAETDGGQRRCKCRELEEHREILKEIWALQQWLCVSFTGLLDTPHGKLGRW